MTLNTYFSYASLILFSNMSISKNTFPKATKITQPKITSSHLIFYSL